ncbi:MAG: ABC transporter ATP-binding protein/permease [Flavobacteriaceae bacterium]|nr:ABC transporter ATP-binding protein/permease [Flavobacteriaceae bacterium]
MKALKHLNKYFIKHKYRLIFGILITVLSKIFAVQIPSFIKKSLNIVEDYNKGLIHDIALVKSMLLQNILFIVAAALLAGFFTFLMRQTLIVMSRLIEFDLKNEIFKQYENLSLRFYKKNRTGDLMNRISEDVGKVRMYSGPAIMYSINMVVLFVVALVKMFSIDTTLTLYALAPLPILSVSIYLLSKVIQKRSAIVQQYLSKLTTLAQETFSGINVIKAYAIENQTIANFDNLAEISKVKNISLYKAQALFFPLMVLLIGISNILVIYIGGIRYINGQIVNIGIIAEFIIYVNMLTWPVAVIGWVTSIVQQAEVSQQRINEFLEEEPAIQNTISQTTNIEGKIIFKNVSFTYEDTNITALKDVSFELEKGETLAILGRTGSGKSTIANLLARLYDVTNGTINIDDKPIKKINLESLRSAIGFVPQDAFLFSDTIKNNIKFGNLNATDKEIESAAKNASVHASIVDFVNGYNTLVGERGVTLSGGQKQRISIARAIIGNPKILIFDDCLSAVDTKTEENILQNLNTISKDVTTLIISHRISSVKNATRIIVLNNGKIVQKGTHNELLKQEGYYKEVYEQQLLEEK